MCQKLELVPGDPRILVPKLVSEYIHKIYTTNSKEEKAITVICLNPSMKSEYVKPKRDIIGV